MYQVCICVRVYIHMSIHVLHVCSQLWVHTGVYVDGVN